MKVIYIQDDRSEGVKVQFCYSEDMQMIDRWIECTYGKDDGCFSNNWERNHPETATGVRNLRTNTLSVEDFISMCDTLGYEVKRVKNEIFKGDEFKQSCLKIGQSTGNKKPA